MSGINGINGSGAIDKTDDVDAKRRIRNSSAPPAAGAAASAKFSKPAELFGKLQKLAEQDPEKLKEIAGKIAETLHKVAAQTGGGGGFLEKLAGSFDELAKSGDLSALQPTADAPSPGVSGHHHHRRHHHGHHGGGASSIANALTGAVNLVDEALSAAPPPTTTPTTATTPTTPATPITPGDSA